VWSDYRACVIGVITDASGECQKAHCLLALEHPDIVFLDCYAHQVLNYMPIPLLQCTNSAA